MLVWTDSPESGLDRFLVALLTVASYVLFVAWDWWFGDVMRARGEREVLLAERTLQLEREREENARRAVIDECVCIARELHDVVAHHVSLMGVQAGAARRVQTRQPDKAVEAPAAIETTSRQAVAGMHRLLGLLRREDEPDSLAPQPSLRQLGILVAQIRDAGPARASVRLRYGAAALDAEVLDDGHGPATNGNGAGGGNGLAGMRERVGLLDGTLQTDYLPGIGFATRAHLPLNGKPR
ncbi:MAG TPA: histidine kinase [Thermomicrobiales bacterium]